MPELTGVGATTAIGFTTVTGGNIAAMGTGDTTTQFTTWLRLYAAVPDVNTRLMAGVVALYSIGLPRQPDLTTYVSKLVERKAS